MLKSMLPISCLLWLVRQVFLQQEIDRCLSKASASRLALPSQLSVSVSLPFSFPSSFGQCYHVHVSLSQHPHSLSASCAVLRGFRAVAVLAKMVMKTITSMMMVTLTKRDADDHGDEDEEGRRMAMLTMLQMLVRLVTLESSHRSPSIQLCGPFTSRVL